MANPFKRNAYKRERKKKDNAGALRKASKLLRFVIIVLGLALLVLPVLLIAHPISYIPLIMVVVMVLLSWVYLRILDRGVSVSINQLEYTCNRGESAGLEVTLTNSSFLPAPRVEMGFVISNLFDDVDEERSLSCSLAPFETVNAAFDAQFPHLGKYEAGVSSVTVHDLLGLFSRKHKDGNMNSVVVKPAKVNLGGTNATQVMPDESNNALKPITSDNEDYASVRDYQRGDPLKTVHWNLSSRNPDGSLYTRLFEEYVNPSLAIVIDCCAPDYDADTLMSLFDGIVETAAALSEQAKASGVDAEIRYFDREGEAALARLSADDDVNQLVESMHRIIPASHADTATFDAEDMLRTVGLQNHGFGNVAFVTSRADDGCLSALRDIAGRRRNAMAFVAIPRQMEEREREKFWAPIAALGSAGASYYAVESTPIATEVVGL